jgi:phosphate starvation-inducible PhoH-like protein
MEGPEQKRFAIDLPDQAAALALAGEAEINLRRISEQTGAHLVLRGLQLHIDGKVKQLEQAAALVELLRPQWSAGEPVTAAELNINLQALGSGRGAEQRQLSQQVLARSQSGKLLRPRTLRQRSYVEAMESHELTLAIGPAGTGKTFLAVVQAVRCLQERRVERIVLTRPAVEAGEELGFLPGDLQQKVDPYLRPLYDALHSLLSPERTAALLEKGIIEVAPLAYMRGRTLADAFVILDEAQNTTCAQMQMVLTRLGENSRMVVTGDPSQVDLPAGHLSGLVEAAGILEGVEGIAICTLTAADVVRHPLVQSIVAAYAKKRR